MSKFVRVCPNCRTVFSAWRTLRITRWSNMRCPACDAALNRNLDLQFAGVCVGALAAFNFVRSLPLRQPLHFLIDVSTIAAVVAADAMTMRLVVVPSRHVDKKE